MNQDDEIEVKGKNILNDLVAMIGRIGWRLAILIVLALCYFQGKNIANAFVAQSPAFIEQKAAIAEAKDAISLAKDTAQTANTKADQSLAVQGKIFDALKQTHDDIENLKISISSSNATTTAEISALGKQLDRVESKQDARN